MKVDKGLIMDARNGDDSLISHATAEEEGKLEQQRCKEEKMDEITNKVVFEDVDEVKEAKKKGRGSKPKALTSSANTMYGA
nr:hypothetical protein [Tanacetum cinerariifolium]